MSCPARLAVAPLAALALLACQSSTSADPPEDTGAGGGVVRTDAAAGGELAVDGLVVAPDGRAGDASSPPADAVPPPADASSPPADASSPPADVSPPPADVSPPPADVSPPPADVSPPSPDAAAGPPGVPGRACVADVDCGPGFMCDLEVPGGYCLPGAPGGPTACRVPDVPCPEGTICSPLPWHAISGVCLQPCGALVDCRAGLFCAVLQLFPGDPASPDSGEPVCWTVCQPGSDQSCNDSALISSVHGHCEETGLCTCAEGFAMNPLTGRCL